MKNICKTNDIFEFSYFGKPRIFNDVYLYQLGNRTCSPGSQVISHLHKDYIEISYIVSGKGIFYIDNKGIEVSENDIFLACPNETHSIIVSGDEPLKFNFIAFSFQYGCKFRNLFYDEKIIGMDTKFRKVRISHFGEVYNELINILKTKNSLCDLEFEYCLKKNLINIYQCYEKNEVESSIGGAIISREHELYFKIVHYIEKHLTEIKKLTDISDALSYNYVYIARVFKEKYGDTLSNYVADKKLEYAEQLILQKKMSVNEISNYLGYSCLPVFSKAFKRKFGISPLKHGKGKKQ